VLLPCRRRVRHADPSKEDGTEEETTAAAAAEEEEEEEEEGGGPWTRTSQQLRRRGLCLGLDWRFGLAAKKKAPKSRVVASTWQSMGQRKAPTRQQRAALRATHDRRRRRHGNRAPHQL
jgi:hypothetical protein